jgi:hypothetical protein
LIKIEQTAIELPKDIMLSESRLTTSKQVSPLMLEN